MQKAATVDVGVQSSEPQATTAGGHNDMSLPAHDYMSTAVHILSGKPLMLLP